jgi:outer membrane receptor for ferric coprogen and ferric-rhodotorulic acid
MWASFAERKGASGTHILDRPQSISGVTQQQLEEQQQQNFNRFIR